MIQFKENTQTNGRMNRQTLFYRTLPATTRAPINEKEKKKYYHERIMQIEHGSFTPVAMSATGGMSRECQRFYFHLSEMISEKHDINYSTMDWKENNIFTDKVNWFVHPRK